MRYSNSSLTTEGNAHIDKIFQLRLSLPPKSQIEIKEYVEQIASHLPENDSKLILSGCPINPRKIKRILNLIYFLSFQIPEESRVRLLPVLIIWAILTVEFPNLANIIKSNYKILIQMALMAFHLDEFENLKLIMPDLKIVINRKTTVNLNGLPMTYKQLFTSTIEGFEQVVNNQDLFNFLKSIASRFNIGINNNRNEDIEPTLNEHYNNEGELLRQIIYSAGLIA